MKMLPPALINEFVLWLYEHSGARSVCVAMSMEPVEGQRVLFAHHPQAETSLPELADEASVTEQALSLASTPDDGRYPGGLTVLPVRNPIAHCCTFPLAGCCSGRRAVRGRRMSGAACLM